MTDVLQEKGSYSLTQLPDWVDIGNYSSVAENVYFHPPHNNHRCINNKKCVYTTDWGNKKDVGKHEKTIIGNDVWIGREAKIMFGVKIGDGAIIGAYTVVTKDVDPFSVMVGNPARLIRYRFRPWQIMRLLEIKWWDQKGMADKAFTPEMQDIDLFLKQYE